MIHGAYRFNMAGGGHVTRGNQILSRVKLQSSSLCLVSAGYVEPPNPMGEVWYNFLHSDRLPLHLHVVCPDQVCTATFTLTYVHVITLLKYLNSINID